MKGAIINALVMLMFCTSFVQSQSSDNGDEEMCFPFRRNPTLRPALTANQQGRPGKIGPPGPEGQIIAIQLLKSKIQV